MGHDSFSFSVRSVVLVCALYATALGCDTEDQTIPPKADAAIGSTGSADAGTSLMGDAAKNPPATDTGVASGCVPGLPGPVLDGTGTADVSFADRIDTNADTMNFFGRGVLATLTSTGTQPPHTLEVTIGFSTDAGQRWLKLKIVDKTAGGIQADVVYSVKSSGDAIAAQQVAIAEYSETRCQYGWESNGKKGTVQISRLQGNLVDLVLGDASFIPRAVENGQRGTFTIRGIIKDLTAKRVTL